MPWTVDYNAEFNIIESASVGRVTDDEFIKGAIRSRELSRDKNTKLFLIDASKWKGGASVVGLYDRPALYEELGFERDSKGALILPPSGSKEAEDAKFYETVCANRAWQVRVFSDRQKAINWLINKESSNKPDAGDG